MIAEINQEEGQLAVQLYPTEAMLNFDAFVETLQKAARRLQGEPTES
ncbi:MAG: hypothetical protein H7Z72_18545 [Bacteroidetes bacterium]|nr:hypothetical protein [Fibrella sp.]